MGKHIKKIIKKPAGATFGPGIGGCTPTGANI